MTDAAHLASYAAFFLVLAGVYATICLGLQLQWGEAGLFNVGVAGFVCVGAYASGLLTAPPLPPGPPEPGRVGGLGLPVAVGWVGAAVASGLAGAFVGAVALRALRGDALAIATFGVAVAVQLAALNATALTGGPFGLHGIPRPFEAALGGTGPRWTALYLGLVALAVAASWWLVAALARSPWGRALRAVREDEEAAAALGKPPLALRLQAFSLGCALMGLGGAMQAHFTGFVAPEDFLPVLTFQAWAMLVVGGASRPAGAVLGALVVWALWTLSGNLLRGLVEPAQQARAASLQVVLVGAALSAMLVLRPAGLAGEGRRRRRSPAPAPAPVRGGGGAPASSATP